MTENIRVTAFKSVHEVKKKITLLYYAIEMDELTDEELKIALSWAEETKKALNEMGNKFRD